MRACIDTNLFVYATYPAFKEHRAAYAFLKASRQSSDAFVITWKIIYEYLRVVTHRKFFPEAALNLEQARLNVLRFCSAKNVAILQETDDHWDALEAVTKDVGKARGNLVHDCHTAALMREHEVKRIYTADVDFRLFTGIETVNPLE